MKDNQQLSQVEQYMRISLVPLVSRNLRNYLILGLLGNSQQSIHARNAIIASRPGHMTKQAITWNTMLRSAKLNTVNSQIICFINQIIPNQQASGTVTNAFSVGINNQNQPQININEQALNSLFQQDLSQYVIQQMAATGVRLAQRRQGNQIQEF